MLELDVYKNRRVLVTGHTGFKGSWLCLWLTKLGAKVYGYALPEENGPAAYSALEIRNCLADEALADLRNIEELSTFAEKVSPEIIFHLGAQALVRKSFIQPLETIQTNILGTAHILEILRKKKVPAVIVTSDKCYENLETGKSYVETDPMGGYDIYSMSKGSCELLTASYRRSFDLNVASARAGNVIGGGDFAEDRILPDCVRSARAKRPVLLRNPDSVRPWQHVLDPISGYLTLGAQLLGPDSIGFREGWNFGPELTSTITVRKLVETFFEYYGPGEIQIDQEKQPHEAKLLHLDINKAKNRLRWAPRWNVQEAVSETSLWYRNFDSGGMMKNYSLDQISRYERSEK